MASVYSWAVTSRSGTYFLIHDKDVFILFSPPRTDVRILCHSHIINACRQFRISAEQYAPDLRRKQSRCTHWDQCRTFPVHEDVPYRSPESQSSRNLYRNGSLYLHT